MRTVLRLNNLQHRKPHLSNKVIVYDLKVMFMSYMTNNNTHNIKTFKSRLQLFFANCLKEYAPYQLPQLVCM